MSERINKDDLIQQTERDCAAEEKAGRGPEAADEMADFDLSEYMTAYKQLLTEKEELEARLLRLQADFDNYRRRQRESQEDTSRQAVAALAETLLPVLDNFDRALEAMQDTPDKQGVEMIYRQLMQVLCCAGLEEVAAAGEIFDPKLHQAVSQCPAAEEDKGRVLLVLQKGYTMQGRLIRASMVQVGC